MWPRITTICFFCCWLMGGVPVIVALQQQQQQPTQQKQKLISLALIPHHEYERRLRQEAALHNRRYLGDSIPSGIHRQPRRRARAGRRTQSQVLDALYQGYGTHYVDLWCGTPTVQRQTVIVDTGSGVTAFPCLGCQDCGDDGHHTDSLFNQTDSASFHAFTCDECHRGTCQAGAGKDECRIGMSYQEGSSWSAFEALDICYAGGAHDHPLAVSNAAAQSTKPPASTSTDDADLALASSFAFPMRFGCQTHLTGLFRTQLADGIMGMDNANTAFWSQMHEAGKIEEKMFSLCFSRQDTVNRKGTEAGAMTLGGTDPRLHTSPMVYTTVSGTNGIGFYPVHMRRVYLRQGGFGDSVIAKGDGEAKVVAIGISEAELNQGGQIILDSGTTDTYFSYSLMEAFDVVWKDLTGRSYDNKPINLTPEQVDKLPTILFQLQGDEVANGELVKNSPDGIVAGLAGALDPDHPLDIIIAMPPSHYMEYDDREKLYVPRFYMDGSGNVLGANTLMGHDVMFDVAKSRVGWAESHCDYSKLLETAKLPNPEPETSLETTNDDVKEEKKEVPTGGDGHDEDTPGSDVTEGTTTTTASKFASTLTSFKESCSSLKCRGGIVGGLVASVLIIALFVRRVVAIRRRAPAPRREYQLTAEMELANVVAEEDDDFVHYRDHRPNGKADYDDDEVPTPPAIA